MIDNSYPNAIPTQEGSVNNNKNKKQRKLFVLVMVYSHEKKHDVSKPTWSG